MKYEILFHQITTYIRRNEMRTNIGPKSIIIYKFNLYEGILGSLQFYGYLTKTIIACEESRSQAGLFTSSFTYILVTPIYYMVLVWHDWI